LLYAQDRAGYEREIKQIEANIEVLKDQKRKEEEGSNLDAAEYAQAKALFDRGSVTITRASDARRAMLLSATRVLQTFVQIQQLERQGDAVRRQLLQLDERRRIDALKELQDARSRLAITTAGIQAASEKVMYSGILNSEVTRAGTSKPELVVLRNADSRRERLDVDEDAELRPGDVVQVVLKLPAVPGILGQ